MTKIWTVYNNYDCEELGAYWHEDEAFYARQEFLNKNEDISPDDVMIEAFTVKE